MAERARQLREQILAWTNEPVNVIAHSMGGLDARYLISRMNTADRVRSLVTLSTAHHGTSLADWFCNELPQGRGALLAFQLLGMDVAGFRDCQTAVCRQFNRLTPDAPGVRYFSYGAAVPLARVHANLRRTWSLLYSREGPNDGIVSAQSARWGEYLGTLAVDHHAQTLDDSPGRGNDFDAVGLLYRIIEDVARRGL